MTTDPTLYIVVVPGSAINPKTGGGQRTRLFFDACVRNGPTELAVMGIDIDVEWVKSNFPGVRKVHALPPAGLVVRAANRFLRKFNGARLMLSPIRSYAPDAAFTATLRAMSAGVGRTVLVFRYARTYCATDIPADLAHGVAVCVDVDDRDDQKYTTYLRKALGRWMADAFFVPTSIRALSWELRRRLAQTSLVWFAAEEDVWDLSPARTAVVPNVAMVAGVPDDLPPPSQSTDILFVGSYGHIPNQSGVKWFLRDCWPLIRTAVPEARLRIVGVGNWASLAGPLTASGGVDLVGAVEDLAIEYARARLTICPIAEGGGSKIKVMEAAKYGRPVVSTTHSARGFNAEFVSALRLADDTEAFARVCMELLQDGAAADAEGSELQRIEAENYSRDALVVHLSDELARIADSLRPTRSPQVTPPE